MIYTFAIKRSPLIVVPDPMPEYGHYFGGPLGALGLHDSHERFARVLTLDLSDPKMSFLRLKGPDQLPLVMDFAEGAIDYSVRQDGSLLLHSKADSEADSLLEVELARHGARLERMPYEQYRASIFSSQGPDDAFLSPDDRDALNALGETYTQVGGSHARSSGYQPYCANPACAGHGTQVTQVLATVSQSPAPDVSLDFLPYDPAIEFTFCMNCHSISGVIVPD